MTKTHQTWNDLIARFEEDLITKGKSNQTVAAYGSCVKNFGRYYQEKLKKPGPYISRLMPLDFETFIDYLRTERYLALNTVNQNIAALRAFSQYLRTDLRHNKNLAQGLKTRFAVAPTKKQKLSTNDIRRILSAVDQNTLMGLRDAAILQLIIRCGVTVGQISEFILEDVKLQSRSGQIKIRDKKTGSMRQVPMGGFVRSALKDYLKARGSVSYGEPLFCSQMGNSISVQRVKYVVKNYLCAAGRPDLSARDLRNYMAQRFYEKNKDLARLQKILGHKNISTTARFVFRDEK
jgi:site-specific recombinase XerD